MAIILTFLKSYSVDVPEKVSPLLFYYKCTVFETSFISCRFLLSFVSFPPFLGRKSDLENIEDVLRDYRNCHGALVRWIEQTTVQQELMKPGQAEDSRVLSEQLSQQMVRMMERRKNHLSLELQFPSFSSRFNHHMNVLALGKIMSPAFVNTKIQHFILSRSVML